jgi:hypothetical protein
VIPRCTHRTKKIHAAIRYALDYLDDRGLIDFSKFDVDGDGYIDAITFVHSGYGAEWGGVDSYGANYPNRIWYVPVTFVCFVRIPSAVMAIIIAKNKSFSPF